MNNIQEMDWAEDCWHGHTGMDSSNDYCTVSASGAEAAVEPKPPQVSTTIEASGSAGKSPEQSR
jgi:hypothetical protein